jgi:hypothetical protein
MATLVATSTRRFPGAPWRTMALTPRGGQGSRGSRTHNAGVAGSSPAPAMIRSLATPTGCEAHFMLILCPTGRHCTTACTEEFDFQDPNVSAAAGSRKSVTARSTWSRSWLEEYRGGLCDLLVAISLYDTVHGRSDEPAPLLTTPVPRPISGLPPIDKSTPDESRGRKATGPRLLRDAA